MDYTGRDDSRNFVVVLGRLLDGAKMKTFLLVFVVCFAASAYAYSDDEVANAIYKAEGGSRAKFLYGIRSVKYKDEADARRICLNTIRNNRARFAKQNKHKDYIEFLASRYCPVGADNDKKGVNKNWIKNVRFFLAKKENK